MADVEDKIIRNGTLVTLFITCLTFVYKGLLAVLSNRKSVRELKKDLEDAQERIDELQEQRERDYAYFREKTENQRIAIDMLNNHLLNKK